MFLHPPQYQQPLLGKSAKANPLLANKYSKDIFEMMLHAHDNLWMLITVFRKLDFYVLSHL